MSMFDPYNRLIRYLRISVTDRCNLRCLYCMPEEGVELKKHSDILTFEEIEEFARVAVSMGIDKVRITGGEPLVRKGVTSLVARLSRIEGIRDLTMTSNGVLLAQYARELKEAGLNRINVSLDTVDPQRFREITRVGDLAQVMRGIDAALVADLRPVKINCVITKSAQEPHALAVADYARERGLEIRYIRQMDLCSGSFWVVQGGDGGNCTICNKLRLTSTGGLRPCLFSDIEYDIRKMGYSQAIRAAVAGKPERGTINTSGSFNNIGG